jgi:hypothetical protein
MPDGGLTLINRTIKSFERDCLAVGDGATDNAPAWMIAAGLMAWGHHVEAGPGLFNYSEAPVLNFRSGGFHGAGPGGELPFYTGSRGTILRHTKTDDHSLKFGPKARTMEFSDFALDPVYRKTGDAAEIFLDDRATSLVFRRIDINYANVAVRSVAAVHNHMEKVKIFAPHGSSGWYATGINGGNRNEGLTLTDCESYTPHKRAPMPEAATLKDYATTSTFAQSDYSIVSGWLMECYTGGDKGASPPSIPPMTYSWEHTGVLIEDGSIVWALVCKADYAAVDADSWGDYVTLTRCRLLEGIHAVRMRNDRSGASSASRPQEMVIRDMQNDHNAGHGCKIIECGGFDMQGSKIDTARGAAVWVGNGTANRVIIGNRMPNCDLGPIVTEPGVTWGPNDMVLGNTPNDGIFARGGLGHARMDTDYGVNQILSRKIGGVEYQWHFGVKSNGGFEIRQDLPNAQVVGDWSPA